jgi:hypothetical protein
MPTPRNRASSVTPASTAISAYRAAAEGADADAVADLLAPDVVFHSPLTARVRFAGREEVAALHRDIFAILEDLKTSEPLSLDDTRSFTFRARVRGVPLEAVVLAHLDNGARIDEVTIFGRPLPALAVLFATLPPRVSTRRRGHSTGTLVGLLARPLAFALVTADRLAPRFL